MHGFEAPLSFGAFSHNAGTVRAQRQLLWGLSEYQPCKPPTCGSMHNQFKTQKVKHLMLAMGPRDLSSAPYSPVHCGSH